MKISRELENELVNELQQLTNFEQDDLKVIASIYISEYQKIKEAKLSSFEKAIAGQIRFYGRPVSEYKDEIDILKKRYENLIDNIIKEYNRRFIDVNNELQDVQSNQKIAMVNMKFSISYNDKIKLSASENKRDNYELVIQECFRQMEECVDEITEKLNKIFFDKDKQLAKLKVKILERILNIFTGKSKIQNFVLNSIDVELNNLENMINNEVSNIKEDTILNIAIIKDARTQTQQIFNQMLKGNA